MEILIESCHRHAPSLDLSRPDRQESNVILVTSCFFLSFLLFEEDQELIGALATVAVVMI